MALSQIRRYAYSIQYIQNLVLLSICLPNDSPENAKEISIISDQKKVNEKRMRQLHVYDFILI